jgi:hypothetical protein
LILKSGGHRPRNVQKLDFSDSRTTYDRQVFARLFAVSWAYDDAMRLATDPFRLLLISLAGWLNQQQDVIDYLQEESRVLYEQLGGKRLRFTTSEGAERSEPRN